MEIGIGVSPGLSAQFAGGAAAVTFTPADLFASSEKGAWWQASPSTCFTDEAGTTPASVGDAVARINDSSGNAVALTQGTAGNRPILRQDGAGAYYLEGDGTDFLNGTGGWGAADPLHMLVVGKSTTRNNNIGFMCVNFTSSTSGAVRAIGISGYSGTTLRIDIRASSIDLTTNTETLSVFEGKFPAGTGNGPLSGAVNGGAFTTETRFLVNTSTPVALGRGIIGTMGFEIYDALIINRPLTADERSDLVSYYASEYGITI